MPNPTPTDEDIKYLISNPDSAPDFKEHFGFIPATKQDVDFLKAHPEHMDDFKEHFGYVPPEAVESSALGSAARGAGRAAVPTAAGLAAFTPGFIGGTAITGGNPIGGLIGGLITSLGAGWGAGKVQQSVLESNPELAKSLGQSPEQQQADAVQHPYASLAGELAPQALALRPGLGTGVQRAAGAVIGGGQEAIQEGINEGTVDPTKVAMAAGAGAFLNTPTRIGKALGMGHISPQQIPDESNAAAVEQPPQGLSRPISQDLPPQAIRAVLFAERNNAVQKMNEQLAGLDPESEAAKILKKTVKEEEFLRDSHGNIEDLTSSIENLKQQNVDPTAIARLTSKRSKLLERVGKIHEARDKAKLEATQLPPEADIDSSALDSGVDIPEGGPDSAALPRTDTPMSLDEGQRMLDASDRSRATEYKDQQAEAKPPGELPDVPTTKQQFFNETMDRQMAANERQNAETPQPAKETPITSEEANKQLAQNDAINQREMPNEIIKDPKAALEQMEKEMDINSILPNVDRTKRVPYGAGASIDGKTMYVDPRIPHTVVARTLGGHPDVKVLTEKYLRIHEAAERWLEASGIPYQKDHMGSHPLAEAMENEALKRDGIDPKSYQDSLKSHLAEAQLEAMHGQMHGQIPEDLVPGPYRDKSGGELLKTNGADAGALQGSQDKYEAGIKNTSEIGTPELTPKSPPTTERLIEQREKEVGEAKAPLARESENTSRATQDERTSHVQKVIDKIVAKWNKSIKDRIHVLPDFNGIPQEIKDFFGASLEHTEAFYHRGHIYLDASKLATPRDMAIAILHEAFHFGVGRFGDAYKANLYKVLTYRENLVETYLARSKHLDANNPEHRLIAAEEVLAYMAEHDPKNTFVQSAIAAIKGFLRKVGFDKMLGTMSDSEIIHNFIDPVRRSLEEQHGAEFVKSAPKASDIESPLRKAAEGRTGVAAWDKDVIPKLKSVSDSFKENVDGLAKLFAPQVRSTDARYTGRSIRENVTGYTAHDLAINRAELMKVAAKNETILDKIRTAFGVSRTVFDGMSQDARLEFIDNMENGRKQPTQELQSVADVIRKVLDKKYKEVDSISPEAMEQFIENYFPHIWKNPKAAAEVFAKFGKASLEGKRAFLKERIFATIKEGMKIMENPDYKGPPLELASTNPIDLVMMKVHEMDKFISASNLLKDMGSKGLIKTVKAGETVPAGYRQLDKTIARIFLPDRIKVGNTSSSGPKTLSRVGHYLPDDVAQVLENFLGPGLRRNSAFRAYMGAANTLNMAQLGLSMFHAAFTTYDAFVSKFALTAKLLADGDYGRAAMKAAEIPFSPVTNFWRGNKLFEAYNSPNGAGGELGRIIDSIVKAGGRVELDPLYMTGVFDSMMKAFNEGEYSRAAIRFPAGVFEGASRIISHYIVPRQKLGVFMDMAKEILVKADDKQWTNDQLRKELQTAWDSVDNRLGQVVYDNLFWNNSVKDGLLGSVRSLGWNLGTARELLGGAVDLASGQVSYRASYLMVLPLVTAAVGSLIGVMNGNPPDFSKGDWKKSITDMYFPRTGNKDINGREQRVSLPSYMKDVFQYFHDPKQTVVDKLNPVLSTVSDMMQNKDFYGTQIYGPDDPYTKKGAEILQFLGKQLLPFGVRNYAQESKTNTSEGVKLAGFFGFNKAPYWLEQTDAERLAGEILKQKIPAGGRTQASYDKSQLENQIVSGLQNMDPTIREQAFKKMKDNLLSGEFTKKDLTYITQKAHSDPLAFSIKHLSGSEAYRVWNVANPDERKKIRVLIIKKIATSSDMSLEDRKAAIQTINGGAK